MKKTENPVKKNISYFPKEEFNKKLDEILKNDPFEIPEKTLTDLVYDILGKKEILTFRELYFLYDNPRWKKTIEGIMNTRKYVVKDKTIGLSKIRVYRK
jgi:hypothetical protein